MGCTLPSRGNNYKDVVSRVPGLVGEWVMVGVGLFVVGVDVCGLWVGGGCVVVGWCCGKCVWVGREW